METHRKDLTKSHKRRGVELNEKAEDEDNSTFPPSYVEPNIVYGVVDEEKTDKADTRLSLHVHSIRKRLCDSDGISAKAAIDGLVHAGILRNDSPEIIKEVTYSQEKGEIEETIIEIWEDK